MKMCSAFAKYGLPRIKTTDDHGWDKYGLQRIDTKDDHGLLYKDITYKIRKAIFKVYNSLGNGHKEAVYQRSLEEEFRKEGLKFENQKHLSVYYDGKKVGDYIPDFVVENKVIVEIKVTKFLTKNDRQQILYYLKGSGYRLALLVNFGSRNLQIKRIVWFPPNEYQKNPGPSVVKNNPGQSEASPKNPWLSVVNNYNPRISVELIIPRRFNWIKENPFDYYGIETIDDHGLNQWKSVVLNPRESELINHSRKSVVLNPRKSEPFKITRLPCLDLISLDKYLGNLGLWIESFTFLISAFFYLLFKKADFFYTRDKEILLLTLIKKNFIYEAHGFPQNYFLYSPFFKKLKGIVVITQKLKELFVEKGIPENKILVAPDGVDLEEFDIKETKEECRGKLDLPLDKKIVLYTGHLYEWKGVDTLAKASQYLPGDVEIYFVGGTKEDVEKFKVRCSNVRNIRIVGHRSHSEIPYWLKAADVLVLPNTAKEDISKYWTSPMKMFEYMASKRPIVASDLPSIREILNENNSILVEPDNLQALANGIKKILQNPEIADKISNQAFQDVQQYTWEKRAKKILEFLKIC
jgi:GxxExxY protein